MKQLLYALLFLFAISCDKVDPLSEPSLVLHFKFDSTQTRLNNQGQLSSMDSGNVGQNPNFKSMRIHYVELSPFFYTQIGDGHVAYKTEETQIGGENAITFDKETVIDPVNNLLRIPLKNLKADDYEFIRISIGYQGYDVFATANLSSYGLGEIDFPMRIASFLGFNTYIGKHTIKDSTLTLNRTKKQGYWASEVHLSQGPFNYHKVIEGQAPGTTVVNPLFAFSPIPSGSCVVTSKFTNKLLKIVPTANADVHVEVSISTNKSFEWKDTNPNGKWDVYPIPEQVTDMGIRGMKSTILN